MGSGREWRTNNLYRMGRITILLATSLTTICYWKGQNMNETNYNKCKQIGAPRPGCYLVCPMEGKEFCIYYRSHNDQSSNGVFNELVEYLKDKRGGGV